MAAIKGTKSANGGFQNEKSILKVTYMQDLVARLFF